MKHCNDCDLDKPDSEFARKTATRLQSKCKECQRAYTKKWYAANRAQHMANVAVNNRRQRRQMTLLVNEHLAKTPCAVCMKRYPVPAMTIDAHWEESARYLASNAYSEAAVREALKTQRVVCANCRQILKKERVA